MNNNKPISNYNKVNKYNKIKLITYNNNMIKLIINIIHYNKIINN